VSQIDIVRIIEIAAVILLVGFGLFALMRGTEKANPYRHELSGESAPTSPPLSAPGPVPAEKQPIPSSASTLPSEFTVADQVDTTRGSHGDQ